MVDQREISNLASGVVNDPARFAECKRYYEAVIRTLNETHTDGEQDAIALFEAFAMCLGQITGNLSDSERRGILAYIAARADAHAPIYAAAGKAAHHFEEAPPEKYHA